MHVAEMSCEDASMSVVRRDVKIGSASRVGLPLVDFISMHEIVLPYRLRRGVSEQISWDLVGVPPIAFQIEDGSGYTYVAGEYGVRIEKGVSSDATVVIQLSEEDWQNYYYELRTKAGLLYSEAVTFVKGGYVAWDAWEPALRCIYSGTPIYRADKLDLRDLQGKPLNICQSFDATSDPKEMTHFLREAGYLHVKGAFTPDEIALFAEEITRMRDDSVEGDIFSRWASDETGQRKVWDLHYMGVNSEVMRSLDSNPMVLFLTGLSRETVAPSMNRDNGTHAILREFTGGSAVDGSYMLGWHQDCGLGGCPITCPRVHVGIQIDAATADSSQLFFLAGSHTRTCHQELSDEEWAKLPVATFDTAPGDVTVHFGCVLHAAPSVHGTLPRRTIYTRFVNPLVSEHLGEYGSFDQVLPHAHQIPTQDEMIEMVEQSK